MTWRKFAWIVAGALLGLSLAGCGYEAPEQHPIPKEATDYGQSCIAQGYVATYHWGDAFDPADGHGKTTIVVECARGETFFLDGRKLP